MWELENLRRYNVRQSDIGFTRSQSWLDAVTDYRKEKKVKSSTLTLSNINLAMVSSEMLRFATQESF